MEGAFPSGSYEEAASVLRPLMSLSTAGPHSSTQTNPLAPSDAASRGDENCPPGDWRGNLVPAGLRPLQQEQRRIHGVALRPTRRPVRQLRKIEGPGPGEAPET